MEMASYIGLSQQSMLRRELEVIAHNIANLNTTGYRARRPEFREYLSPGQEDMDVSFVTRGQDWRETRTGALVTTHNTLDMALHGRGYFVVSDGGNDYYTRNGNFSLNPEGTLVDLNGYAVQGRNGIITIPLETNRIEISEDGIVLADGAQLGQIRLVRFLDEQNLVERGNTLFASTEEPEEDNETSIKQGMLEQSNVQAVVEMTRMIEVSRAYQSAQRMMDNEHERQRKAIEKIMSMN